jgi:hypothetical protein
MTTAPAIAPARPQLEPDICHEVCCDENRALCGEDVTGQPWVNPGDPITCPLCLLTEQCPDCGGVFVDEGESP